MHDLVNERWSEMDNEMIVSLYLPFDEVTEAVNDMEKSIVAF
jgi:hypothetical protein